MGVYNSFKKPDGFEFWPKEAFSSIYNRFSHAHKTKGQFWHSISYWIRCRIVWVWNKIIKPNDNWIRRLIH